MIRSNSGVSYREMLTGGRFYYGAEVVTTRGLAACGRRPPPTPTGAFARALLDDPRIGWISVTDNPGGGPMLPPDWLAGQVADRGARVVVHLTCKDANRNGLETAAWRYASEGFNNILAITGDYPTTGFGGLPEPVFDLDSVGLIMLLRAMNEGLQIPGPPRQRRDPAEDRFLHRLRRLAVQAARARIDAAVLQARSQDRRRRPVGHSAVGLRHAEVPRGEAAAGRPRHGPDSGRRQRLPALQGRGQSASTTASWPAAWSATSC